MKKYSNKIQSPTASYNSYKKINWTEPKPTKSGRDAVEIWNDLKHAWSSYKMYLMYDDKINMIIKAKLIRNLQIQNFMEYSKMASEHKQKFRLDKKSFLIGLMIGGNASLWTIVAIVKHWI